MSTFLRGNDYVPKAIHSHKTADPRAWHDSSGGHWWLRQHLSPSYLQPGLAQGQAAELLATSLGTAES